MKKLSKIFALALTAAMLLSLLAACGPTIDVGGNPTNTPGGSQTQNPNPGSTNDPGVTTPTETVHDKYAAGTVLRMGTGYNSDNTGIAFDSGTAKDGITLANGKTYLTGDLKPTWEALQERLNVVFDNNYQGNSASDEFKYWIERMYDIDMVSGTASLLNENGAAGHLVDIGKYLDEMPYFKAYLEQNPIVMMSIMNEGSIYYSPYFDGVNDIERMPLMRTDWVEKLLNYSGEGEDKFTASNSKSVTTGIYTPYMPTTGTVSVESVNAAGTGTVTITKDYSKYGNIIEKMNAAGSITGVEAVNMLRDYIDATYGGYYKPENRADLFIGQDACWDADELVALLRCVVANPQTLNGTNAVQGIFSREEGNNSRRMDMIRLAGTLFGVRGVESRYDWIYVGSDGLLHDTRTETAIYDAMERMNALVKEGLISGSFLDKDSAMKSEQYIKEDLGFMSYDYNQTQTIFNEQSGAMSEGEEYRAVMVPVARWNDGTGDAYFRFTESWRSVKTDGWGISAKGVAGDDNKLYAALSLIDYAYSPEGQILMSYGPDEFIKTNADGSYVTFSFNGEQWPVIADATYAELWEKQSGNYTNYARRLLGSTLSFVKSQAFEYQCTTEAGRLGAGYISNAIALGTIKHPSLEVTSNPWYTCVPTTLPLYTVENDTINTYTELSSQFSTQSGDRVNVLMDIIISGYTDANLKDAASAAAYVAGSWNGTRFVSILNDGWSRAQSYYNG